MNKSNKKKRSVDKRIKELEGKGRSYWEQDKALKIEDAILKALNACVEIKDIACSSHWCKLKDVGDSMIEIINALMKQMDGCIRFELWAYEQEKADEKELSELKAIE